MKAISTQILNKAKKQIYFMNSKEKKLSVSRTLGNTR